MISISLRLPGCAAPLYAFPSDPFYNKAWGPQAARQPCARGSKNSNDRRASLIQASHFTEPSAYARCARGACFAAKLAFSATSGLPDVHVARPGGPPPRSCRPAFTLTSDQSPSRAPRAANRGAACVSTWLGEPHMKMGSNVRQPLAWWPRAKDSG